MSEYVRWVRSKVGHERLLLPTVTVLIRDDRRRIVMVRNVETGRWGFVGGMVEPGESPAEAAVREAKEETGLDVDLLDITAAIGGPQFEVEHPNGDRVACVGVVYEAVVTGGEMRPDHLETSEVEWVEPSRLQEIDLNPIGRALIEELGLT